MDEVSQAVAYIFALSVILLIVVYYIGFRSDVNAFSAAINSLLLTATGRNASGQFASYPTGGS